MENLKLVEEAIKARELSYAPYSKFKVGAAVLTKDGRVFHGANIENAAYGSCMCAERNALFNAYMHGCRKDDIVALALVGDTTDPISPCGSCRQVMSELMSHDVPIIMATMTKVTKVCTLEDLLPYAFDSRDL